MTMLNKAYIVPHPPLILPEIGKGKEKLIQNTINAYRMIAHDIAASNIQTLIIISSHAPSYEDYIQISTGVAAYGDFSSFHAEEVSMKVFYDEDFVELICNEAMEEELPAGILGLQDKTLDHGTMIPLSFILQEYEDFKVVRIGISNLNRSTHIAFGNCLRRAIELSGKNVAVIVSGDLSHRLQDDGTYGFNPMGPAFDKQIIDIVKNNDYAQLLDIDEYIVQESANCIYPSLLMLYGLLQAYPFDSQFLSYEHPFGVGYLTAMIRIVKKDPYVALAREALEFYVRTHTILPLKEALPKEMHTRKAGVFVSISKFGELRGCIGTICPIQENIGKEIIHNAIAAAMEDPRFLPIEEKELPYLEYQVDVLSETTEVKDIKELDTKRYGVIVRDHHRKGLLLPDIQGIDSPLQQISIALEKAGMSPDEPFQLERFEVKRHQEYINKAL